MEPIEITEENATEVAAGMSMTSSLIAFQDTMGFETLTSEGTGTYDCPEGGSITGGLTVDEDPVGVLSTGDLFAVQFDNCAMDLDATINGGISIQFDTINGDWTVDDVWDVDVEFVIDGLTFSSGPSTGYFDGAWTQNTSFDTGDKTFSLAGDFTTTLNDGSGYQSAVLNGIVISWAYDAGTGEATYSVDGTFASTELGGSVTVTTLDPFAILDTEANPHAGSLQAEGALGSTLTFTALDETFVQIDVDADGDGTNEYSVSTTWAAIQD